MRDGAVLPILHLNGYKIANPTVLARIGKEELASLFTGYGYKPYFVEGHDPEPLHQQMTATLETALAEIQSIQKDARTNGFRTRPRWPMIILRTPKGWTGPKFVDGKPVEDSFRSHQVPLADLATHPDRLKMLEEWMKSYKAEELFDENGKLLPELAELAPKGTRRMGANPHRQRRRAAARPGDARLPRLCGEDSQARRMWKPSPRASWDGSCAT